MRRQLRENLLPSSSNHPAKNSTSSPSEKRRKRDYIVVLATSLSLLATFLSLGGYGLTLSIEQFNVPHEILFGSTLDLIDLSCWLVVYLFEGSGGISVLHEIAKNFIKFSLAIPVVFLALFFRTLFFNYGLRRACTPRRGNSRPRRLRRENRRLASSPASLRSVPAV